MPNGPRRVPAVRERGVSTQLDRMQRTGVEIAEALHHCPFLVGKAKRVRFEGGVARTVNHRLGARASFIVIRHNFNGDPAGTPLAELEDDALDPLHQMKVISVDDCLVDLWFYPRLNLEIDEA
jgi:hypothetical protein